MTRQGSIETTSYEQTAIPGLYVAGDASRHVQLSVVAAAEGAMAAFAIDTELLKESLHISGGHITVTHTTLAPDPGGTTAASRFRAS